MLSGQQDVNPAPSTSSTENNTRYRWNREELDDLIVIVFKVPQINFPQIIIFRDQLSFPCFPSPLATCTPIILLTTVPISPQSLTYLLSILSLRHYIIGILSTAHCRHESLNCQRISPPPPTTRLSTLSLHHYPDPSSAYSVCQRA